MLLPPTLFRFSFSWRVHHARYPSGPAHDEPTAYIAPSSPCPSACLPAPRSALAHPLCLGVHGIYKHHSASVDSLLLLPPPRLVPVACLSLFYLVSLSLTLNKKSLLIARNLWDSASPSTCVKFFFSIYFYTYIRPLFSYTCVYTAFSQFCVLFLEQTSRKCFSSYYCSFFANYLYIRTYCRCMSLLVRL